MFLLKHPSNLYLPELVSAFLAISSQIADLDNFVDLSTGGSNSEKRYVKFDLSKDYRSSDAHVIGRMLINPKAHFEAIKIWNALIQFQHNRNLSSLPLEVGFPFIGKIQLRAYGIHQPTPKHCKNKHFLALSLLGCSHPLPFDTIQLGRKNDGRKGRLDNLMDKIDKPVAYPNTTKSPFSTDSLDENNLEGENDPFSNPSGYVEDEVAIIKTS